MTLPVLDRDHLALYTGGDTGLEAELFGLLTAQIAACLAKMENAADAEDWQAAAHTLKGAARGVGAMALGQACEAAEAGGPDTDALKAVAAEAERALAAMEQV
jgi:HPt (histidine-containing phosphotransfer) domain-containing protein